MILDIKLEFSTSVITKKISYPQVSSVEIDFDNNQDTPLQSITINGLEANKYYNTSFTYKDTAHTIYSAHIIPPVAGTFTLQIDDLYLKSLRSNNWHISKLEKDFIFQYEFTRSSFTDTYRDRNHFGFVDTFIPCFGCEITYGFGNDTQTWPYQLRQETNNNFLNLGVADAGIDIIYNNLKLLHSTHRFTKCILVVPPMQRRLVKAKVEDYIIRISSKVNLWKEKNISDLENTDVVEENLPNNSFVEVNKHDNVTYVKPNFDREWSEAQRYKEFKQLGKTKWIELAMTGEVIDLQNAYDVNNSDAQDYNSLTTLASDRLKRTMAQIKTGKIELPILAEYSDGYKELIAGNTRLTAMMALHNKAKVWRYRVPVQVHEFNDANNFHYFGYSNVRTKFIHTLDKAAKDIDHKYSKKIISKIINFCADQNIKLYMSSWNDYEHQYLNTIDGFVHLPKFTDIDTFNKNIINFLK